MRGVGRGVFPRLGAVANETEGLSRANCARIRIGAENGEGVVVQKIAGANGNGDSILQILGPSIVRDTLGKSQGFGSVVVSHPAEVRTAHVAHTTAIFVHVFERKPHGHGLAVLEHAS